MYIQWRTLAKGLAAVAMSGVLIAGAKAQPAFEQQLRSLQEQNTRLQEQLRQQQELLSDLNRQLQDMKQRQQPAQSAPEPAPQPPASKSFGFGKINISGEGGVAFFDSGSRGQFPNAEFRVDEAKLFIEAPVWNDLYFFSELNIVTRDEGGDAVRVGELYLDFENPLRLDTYSKLVNLRAGRVDVPFGEEYLTRDAIDNPLISHSLSDLWGVDEGIELYGSVDRLQYVLAVQNGSHPVLGDYTADKSVSARVAYDPFPWLHLSVSGMRTGDLDVQNEPISELWFGSAFIRPLGDPASTTLYHAELAEADVQLRWARAYLKGAGGYIHYDDNDSAADNRRDIYYHYIEGLYHITKKIYGAARFSQIFAHKGYFLLGNGDWGQFFYEDLTSKLSRLSAGVGYRPSENFLLKSEFTWNTGKTENGNDRLHENFVGVEAAFKF